MLPFIFSFRNGLSSLPSSPFGFSRPQHGHFCLCIGLVPKGLGLLSTGGEAQRWWYLAEQVLQVACHHSTPAASVVVGDSEGARGLHEGSE